MALLNGKIIGSIMSGHNGRRSFIYHASVFPDYRHQGIATQLIDAALTVLKKEGIALRWLLLSLPVIKKGIFSGID